MTSVARLLRLAASLALSCAFAVVTPATRADTVYTWTDDKGVVHFADAPPPNIRDYDQRDLPSAPPAKSRASEPGRVAEPAGPTPSDGDAAATVPTPPPHIPVPGPARIVILSRDIPRTGPSTVRVKGEVKNVGTETANNVTITITANDSRQGNPCLHEEVSVTPAKLSGGEVGSFDVDVDSPCLFGEPNVDVIPSWD